MTTLFVPCLNPMLCDTLNSIFNTVHKLMSKILGGVCKSLRNRRHILGSTDTYLRCFHSHARHMFRVMEQDKQKNLKVQIYKLNWPYFRSDIVESYATCSFFKTGKVPTNSLLPSSAKPKLNLAGLRLSLIFGLT